MGDYERAVELLQEIELPEARYNLGLLKAKQRDLTEAYELLRPYSDVNSAILALSLNKNEEAKDIMQGVTASTAVSEYVRSMISARFHEDGVFFDHLVKACEDGKLRRRAADEPDFDYYKTDGRFVSIVNR